MATFIGTNSVNFIRPDFVSQTVTANPAGSRPGAGADFLDGRGGADDMNGGDGSDTYIVDNVGDTTEESNTGPSGGFDTVNASVTYSLSAALEALLLTGSGDIDGIGNGKNNVITGNSGDNELSGRAGDDTMDGRSGRDTMFGGSGEDTLDGGTGADTMDGGAGDDTYEVDHVGDIVAEQSDAAIGGVDTVFARADHDLGFGIENLTFEGVGNFSGDGNDLDNVMRGNDGANTLSGLDGDDTLIGGFGGDILEGGLGDDILRGQRGADTLQGGGETDILIGGQEDDVFDFNAASHSDGVGRDVIRGGDGAEAFEDVGISGGDRIDVSGIDADTSQNGNQAFIFGGNGVGHLSLVNENGITVVRGNTTAGGGFEFEVAIEDGLFTFASDYAALDFIL